MFEEIKESIKNITKEWYHKVSQVDVKKNQIEFFFKIYFFIYFEKAGEGEREWEHVHEQEGQRRRETPKQTSNSAQNQMQGLISKPHDHDLNRNQKSDVKPTVPSRRPSPKLSCTAAYLVSSAWNVFWLKFYLCIKAQAHLQHKASLPCLSCAQTFSLNPTALLHCNHTASYSSLPRHLKVLGDRALTHSFLQPPPPPRKQWRFRKFCCW